MTDRIFRLTQSHRKNDQRLHFERRSGAPDPSVISWLLRLKDRVKSLMARLMSRPV